MRKLLLSFMLVCLFCAQAHAVRVSSIYKAKIPVASESAEDRTRALQEGMAQVFIKVSGNSHILQNSPELKSHIDHADASVEEYNYSPAPKTALLPLLLSIRFDPQTIDRFLKEEGAPIWGKNRPLILTWLAVESPTQPADIIDSSGSEVGKLLKSIAEQRGIPVILPSMDVTDLGHISPTDVMKRNLLNIRNATSRYASDAILIGRISETGKNSYTSEWQLILGPDNWTWSIPGKNKQDILSSIINSVADTLAERYAVVITNSVQGELTLQVSGIKQQSDLIQLMKYLQHLTPVGDVQLAKVSQEAVFLNISLRGSKKSLIRALGLARALELVSGNNQEEDNLAYRWVR